MVTDLNELNYQEGMLLHHWDTDGMCAGALMLRNFPDLTTFTPSIGNYYLNDEDRERIDDIDPDFIVVGDMALPEESIEFLKSFGNVFIFDHHLQKKHEVELHHNPVIEGGSPRRYPSASWVVGEYFDSSPNLLTILGAFGDREEKLKENEYAIGIIEDQLDKWDTDFEQLLTCAEYLDSLYKLGERKKIEEMPQILKELERPEEVLKLDGLKENVDKLKSAIENEVEGKIETLSENILFKEMGSPYNIISTVTRKIAWSKDDKIVIIFNCKFKEGECQIYIRGPIPDSEKIINKAKEKGYSAGGKDDVVGMVIPTTDKENFLKDIVEMLKD
ncbi:MAG: hypothetical protein R6W73_03175 [Candidatus Saliniplasma sp.]